MNESINQPINQPINHSINNTLLINQSVSFRCRCCGDPLLVLWLSARRVLSLSGQCLWLCIRSAAPVGSPSCGGDVAVCIFDINQPSLPTPFYSGFVSISVFVALSTIFHFIYFPDNSPLSHSVLRVFISALLVLSTIYLYKSLHRP